MKLKLFFSLLFVIGNVHAADFLTGYLIDNGDNSFDIQSPKGTFQIETSDEIKKSLPSLANPTYVTQSNGIPYSFEFKGELKKGNVFELAQTPTNIPGAESITGTLQYDLGTDKYSIGDQEVTFGYTKVLNNYSFDEKSKQSFVNKEIIAEGEMRDGVFVMQALTPVGLFSALPSESTPYDAQIKKDAHKFIKETIYQNEISKSQNSFRTTVYNKAGYEVKPGESVFLVTLSGRQGDSFGSVNGHFVAGLGEVKEDMNLRAEVSNAYVTNGKDILSGNTSLTNYFSNLVQGQNVYRPSYTFIAYGIDKSKLKEFRDFLEPSHIDFRTKKLEITLEFNCTTETAKALVLAGIVGNHRRTLANRLFDFNNWGLFMTEPIREGSKYLGEGIGALGHVLTTDKEDFQPRPAFHSYIDSLKHQDVIKKLGIKRMDYVFYSQIPSNRPMGGAPSNSPLDPLIPYDSKDYKKLYDKHEVNKETKLSHEDLLKELLKLDYVE